MGNWQEHQAAKKEVKEKDRSRKETLAKYFFDLSKLTFTALVLGGILSFFQSASITLALGLMIVFGIIAAVFLARIGNNILKQIKYERRCIYLWSFSTGSSGHVFIYNYASR